MKDEFNREKEEKVKGLLKAAKRVDVSDAGLKKFRRRLQAEPDRKPIGFLTGITARIKDAYFRFEEFITFPVPALAGAVCTFLAIILTGTYLLLPQTPVVHEIEGIVKIFDSSRNTWVFAKNNQKIGVNDIVKTFEDGRADISLKGVYSMRLRRDSEVACGMLNSRYGKKKIQFYLEKGKVLAYYAGNKGKKKRNFAVETDEIVAEVLGTDFMVQAMPDIDKTWVGVLEGVVKVTGKDALQGLDEDASVYVESRYKTEVTKGQKPLKPKRMMEDEWLDLSELYSIGSKPQVALLISSGSSRTRELLSLIPLYISDKKPGILPDKLREMVKIFNKALKDGSYEKHMESIGQFKAILKEYPNPVYDVQFMLFIAAYYNYIEDYTNAVKSFEEVLTAYPKSRLASIAQCAIGLIYEEKIGDKARAEKAYKKVISSYPNSPEVEEAFAGLSRLAE